MIILILFSFSRGHVTSGPLYKLLTTDLGGERRFAAAVARRLQSLGMCIKKNGTFLAVSGSIELFFLKKQEKECVTGCGGKNE